MELTRIAGGPCRADDDPECSTGDCPTVYTTDRGTVAVQGLILDEPVGEGESMVEIPLEMLREAARRAS
jgi:hypothetical protein